MRVPRRLARVGGAADLPDAAAFDAYVGPSAEITVDHIRGIIALHDGLTPGGKQFSISGAGGVAAISAPQARLSLVAGVSVPESDVAGAASIYLVPTGGNRVPIYSGSQYISESIAAGLTLDLDSNSGHAGYHQSGKNFDLFAVKDGAVVRLVSGPAWTGDTSRGVGAGTTELEMFEGFFVNKNAISVRHGLNAGDVISLPARRGTYLGSFRAVANGQASDTVAQRLLFNAFNPAIRKIFAGVPLATPSYAYSASAWQSLNNLGLKVEVLMGLTGRHVSARFGAQVANSTGTIRVVRVAIALDNTSPADGIQTTAVASSAVVSPYAFYEGAPGLGYHYLMPIEWGGGADVQTWFTAPTTQWGRTGMLGSALL